ncbi:MAG: zf-TFIIB domain-containing protein [Kofleriaceae bacterium]
MNCPVCKLPLEQAGRTVRCARCDGAWIQADVLVPLLEQSAATLVELDWQPNTEAHVRACPECATAMQTVKLGTVALDRCEPHGVWFDAKELAALLGQAGDFRAKPQPHESLLHRLHRLLA